MKSASPRTTMVSLFPAESQAAAAVHDLVAAGVPPSAIGIMSLSGTASNHAALDKWNVSGRAREILMEGISHSGMVIALTAPHELTDSVQAILERHQAERVIEANTSDNAASTQKFEPSTFHGRTIEMALAEAIVARHEFQRCEVRVFKRMPESLLRSSSDKTVQ